MAGGAGVGNLIMPTPGLGHSVLQHDAHSPQQGEPGQFRNMSLLPILPTPTTLLYFILLELTDSKHYSKSILNILLCPDIGPQGRNVGSFYSAKTYYVSINVCSMKATFSP